MCLLFLPCRYVIKHIAAPVHSKLHDHNPISVHNPYCLHQTAQAYSRWRGRIIPVQSSSSSPLSSPPPAGHRGTEFKYSWTNSNTRHAFTKSSFPHYTSLKLFYYYQVLMCVTVWVCRMAFLTNTLCAHYSWCFLNTGYGYCGANTSHNWPFKPTMWHEHGMRPVLLFLSAVWYVCVCVCVFTLASEVTVTSRILNIQSLSSSWLLAARSSTGPVRMEPFGTREKTYSLLPFPSGRTTERKNNLNSNSFLQLLTRMCPDPKCQQ